MSQYDPTALTLDYADRAAETRRSLASSAWAAATGMQVGSIAPGQSDEVYLQIVEELPEAAVDQAGRLLYQRREDANDLLYLGIINDSGDPQWVLVSELQETAEEVGLYKWTQSGNSSDAYYGIATTGTELLSVEWQGLGTTQLIRRRNLTTGASIGTFGSYGTGNGQFQQARGIGVSAAGNIYVSDSSLNRVVQFNSSRTFVRNIGSSGTGNGQLQGPTGIAFDSSSNVYVADPGNDRVVVFSSTGTWLRNIGTAGSGVGQMSSPYGVAISSTGELFVSDSALSKLLVFTASTGTFLREFGTYGSSTGQFANPSSLAMDATDYLYVADTNNSRVLKLSTTGVVQAVIGTTGTIATGVAYKATGVAVLVSDVYITSCSTNTAFGTPMSVKRYTVVPAGGVEVSANSAGTSSARAKLNFIAGSGISVAVADDSTNLEADITVAAATGTTSTTVAAGNHLHTGVYATSAHTHTVSIVRDSATASCANNNSATATATCSSGSAISCNCSMSGGSATGQKRLAENDITTTSCLCTYYNTSGSSQTITAEVVCLVTTV